MIQSVVIVAIMVWAIHYTYKEKEIFGFVSKWGEKYIPQKLQKPVFECPVCMLPWYGLPIYLIGHRLGIEVFADARWQQIVFVLVAGVGFNAVLTELFPKEEIVIKAPPDPEDK